MRCSLVAALVLLIVALVLGAGCTTTRAYTRDQLQARVAPRFPVEKRQSVFVVRMSNPQVAFAGDRLSLALDLDASAAAWTMHGHAVVLLVAQLAERPLYTLDATHGGDEARARKHLRRVWIADDRLMLLFGS